MTSKIDFYREVLADDPNSRVFFPLAKLLSQQGETGEAVEVLQGAIGLHPAHLEARFLLVELLSRLGRSAEAETVFESLSSLLSDYPAVWTLWAAKAPGLSRDGALALRFLALSLSGGGPSWLEVLEKGLAASPGSAGPRGTVAPEDRQAEDEASPAEEPAGEFSLRGADEVMALTQRIEASERRAPAEQLPPECASASASVAAVKTRTMADLLARHGDFSSALEIYGELLRMASTPQEKQAFAARIQEIESWAASGAAPAKQPPPREPKSRAKLVSMLEALATRLDARAIA